MTVLKENIKELLYYCAKLSPFMACYKMQINAHNATVHQILKNEVDLILPKFYTEHRNKRGIFGAIISGFIGLAFEGISSCLHDKRHNALQKAVKAMSISTDMQRNKLLYLENSLIMYGVYNAETLEKLVKQLMSYIVDSPLLKIYLQERQQQHMKFTHKCIMHMVFSIMQSVPYYIYIQSKINILQFTMNLFHNYEYMPRL